MFSHITVGVQNLDRAGTFYDALLTPLGLRRRDVVPDSGPPCLCWVGADHLLPRFYAYIPFDGNAASAGNGTMVAFLAASADAVAVSYAAGLAAGGSDEGAPNERLNYGKGYFGAYLRDPDGNKLHVVCRGDI